MHEVNAEARLRELLAENSADLLAYFVRRVERPEDAADLLSETSVVAWRRIKDVPTGIQARMWLFGVASKVLANHRRSGVRRTALVRRLRSVTSSAVTTPSTEEAVEVREAVRSLAPEHRELVMLVHWDGFSLAEAAAVLGLNASTARGRYAAARARLRSALGNGVSVAG